MNIQDYFLQYILECCVQHGLSNANYRDEFATFVKDFETSFPYNSMEWYF